MQAKSGRHVSRNQRPHQVNSEGLNWVFIVGGAVLTTFAIKVGCKLKQAFTANRTTVDGPNDLKGLLFVQLVVLSYYVMNLYWNHPHILCSMQELQPLVLRTSLKHMDQILICTVLSRVKMSAVTIFQVSLLMNKLNLKYF